MARTSMRSRGSKPAKGRKTYPYLLSGLRIDSPNQVWCADINLAVPQPKGLVGAAAKMAVGKLIDRGWLQEVDSKQIRPVVSAAISVVPDPTNGSNTAWPGLELFRIGRRMHSTGSCVPWTVAASWSLPEICQRVVCLRSPADGPRRSFSRHASRVHAANDDRRG